MAWFLMDPDMISKFYKKGKAAMKKIMPIIIAALVAGCTSCHCIDIANGDFYGYSYAPWQSKNSKDMAARAEYYEWGARTQYGADTCHRIEIVMYDSGDTTEQTNVLKRARYWICGEKE